LTALRNGGAGFDGVYLDTFGLPGTKPQNVTLTGTNQFFDNGDFGTNTGSGLAIFADGQIKVNNLTSSFNADRGAVLDNFTYWWTGTPGIFVTGRNNFNHNFSDGLYFDSTGQVTLYKITADGNGGSGVDGFSDGRIYIYGGSMTMNGMYGWYLGSPDVVTLKGVFAFGNGVNNGFHYGGGTLVIKRY
jgi:hypothetical protein